MREDAVRGIAAEEFIGVAGGSQAAFVVQRRLLRKTHARFELVLPFFADFDDDTGKFMARDDRIGIDVLRSSFVVLALFNEFIRRHADAVGDDFC